MSTVRVYKSTDPGAPPHPSATRGSMAALLRACLVEGWTSGDFVAEPAGWEEPYPEINNYACFRALSGVRQFFQIDDNQSNSGAARMYGFDSMLDAENGNGWGGSMYFGKTGLGSEWYVVADEKTCYVFLRGNHPDAGELIPHGFGELYSFLAEDPYKSFIAGHSRAATLPGGTAAQSVNNLAMMTASQSANYAVASNIYPFPVRGVAGADLMSGGDSASLTGFGCFSTSVNYMYPQVNSSFYFDSVPLGAACSISKLLLVDSTRPLGIGNFRGIYYPLAHRPATHSKTQVIDGKTYMAINCGTSTTYFGDGQMFIDITGSWEESS